MSGPLDGIRVVDWTIWQQGPYAGVLLADLGAEVIKVEERVSGDPGRGYSVDERGLDYYIEANNRHKKSIALDLKRPEALEIIYQLVERSDVFLQNFRFGVARRLKLDYETLQARNPRLIYGSATGYGPEGPEAADPSFDYLGQARSGILNAVSGPPGMPPSYITGGIADQMGAVILAFGVMTALLERERSGVGQELNTSHLGSMIALQGLNVTCKLLTGKEMPRPPREEAGNPLWNHYQCKDGKWLALAMLQTDRYWKDLAHVLGIDELADDPRFDNHRSRGKNRGALISLMDSIFLTKPREQWLKELRAGGDFIFTVVNSVSDLQSDPQVIANNYVVDYEHPAHGPLKLVGAPVIFSRTPAEPRGRAPMHGEHTETVLTEILGYSWDDIEKLRQTGAI